MKLIQVFGLWKILEDLLRGNHLKNIYDCDIAAPVSEL